MLAFGALPWDGCLTGMDQALLQGNGMHATQESSPPPTRSTFYVPLPSAANLDSFQPVGISHLDEGFSP